MNIDKIRIVMFSDTHTKHKQIKNLPDGDLLLCAGDFTNVGGLQDVIDFNVWLGEIKHKYTYGVICIAGNHDMCFDPDMVRSYIPFAKTLITNAIYLENSGIEIEGIKIWGTPINPEFMNWAFNRKRGPEIAKEWAKIPSDTNILIVHSPPYGFNDKSHNDDSPLGCKDLLNRINQLDNLNIIVFGHIHGGYGLTKWKQKTYINASIVNESYNVTNKPIIVDLYKDGCVLNFQGDKTCK